MTAMTIPDAVAVTPEVAAGLEELERAFPEHAMDVLPDGQGGVWAKLHDVTIGSAFLPARSWVAFPLSFQYPRAHVYPHYLRPDVALASGQAFAPPLHPGQRLPGFDEPALMVSRASHRWDPARDTAALKLIRVLDWLRGADELALDSGRA